MSAKFRSSKLLTKGQRLIISMGEAVVGTAPKILSHGCGMPEVMVWAKHTLCTDFCTDCTFFCGDTPLFAPANADAQNASEIATLAHQIDQPHNPPGRVVVLIPRMCAFSPGGTSKKTANLSPLTFVVHAPSSPPFAL
jgi:hypothetical protein